ncbi:hypothetical protein A9Q99_02470 [Gammaproteobacteria bacterium 45_16_T64]|nr:hypothetical protein A9Q99_02470 [Gammaproteobacteria bacterium 45_16_T64]
MNLLTYFHTVRYLKLSQVYYRIRGKFVTPRVSSINSRASSPNARWVSHELYSQKLYEDNVVRFLGESGVIDLPGDWNMPSKAKLWLYNLHYFDDLQSLGRDSRVDLQMNFVNRWIEENPAPIGNGWEPYPASLRIVNWIKFFLSGASPSPSILDSLAQQADYLFQTLEYHLLGNHLFANAKALIFSGLYCDCVEARSWYLKGLEIYRKELREQVLSDGGNFELSPMYHTIMLVDILDLINVFQAYEYTVDPGVAVESRAVAHKMLRWLREMSHPDEAFSFFNDAAFGIAPDNSVVFGYARKLGITQVLNLPDAGKIDVIDLVSSGYLVARTNEWYLVADLAPIGPDYMPGHAHADSLSFELSVRGRRVFVNSGISEYGLGEERTRQRKTFSHNTVSVNEMDSSHVWSGFRVAKRARITNRSIDQFGSAEVVVKGAHDGFKRKRGMDCLHHREWHLAPKKLIIVDRLEGGYSHAAGYLHIHPDMEVELKRGVATIKGVDFCVSLSVSGAELALEGAMWHPYFGSSVDCVKLRYDFLEAQVQTQIILN